MPAQPHIIRKQVLNVRTTGGNADGVRLQQETEQLYRTQVLPGLERLLDKYGDGDAVISIDKLAISLTGIKPDRIGNTLAKLILDEVERQLQQMVQRDRGENTGHFTAEERFLQSWIHYLQQGYFPWWAGVKDSSQWQQQLEGFIQEAPASLLQHLKSGLANLNFVSRLAAQVSGNFWQFFKRLSGWHADLLDALQADEQKISSALSAFMSEVRFRSVFYELLLSVSQQAYTQHLLAGFFAKKLVNFLHEATPEGLYALKSLSLQTEELKEVIEMYAGSSDEIPELPVTPADTDVPAPANEEGIYINNAGVVLIAPYLPAFFSRMDLVKDNMITDLQRATGLLNYINTGKDDYAEFEMVLPKILCGVMPETAVADDYRVTDEEKEQADELLSAVISHWDALKTTSVEGLRNTFLQREGKLILKNDAWMLQVQEQPFDMLLDYLPWSISMIRLPWMQQILQVSWR